MIRRFLRSVIAATALLFAGSSAVAEITQIDPFSGAISETWESFDNYAVATDPFLANPTSIFGTAASISNPFVFIYEPSAGAGFDLGSSGAAGVADGTKAMGIADELATITFASGVNAFGGYWASAVPGTAVMFSFFDASSGLLGSENFTYDRSTTGDGLLEWHGWQSNGALIKTVTYSAIGGVVGDGLQAHVTAVPEPEIYALMLAGLGVIGVVARRRTRAT